MTSEVRRRLQATAVLSFLVVLGSNLLVPQGWGPHAYCYSVA